MIYSNPEGSFYQKASDQPNVVVRKKYPLELVQQSLVPDPVEGFLNIKKDGGGLLALTAGFRHLFDQPHQLMGGGVRSSGSQTVEAFEVLS